MPVLGESASLPLQIIVCQQACWQTCWQTPKGAGLFNPEKKAEQTANLTANLTADLTANLTADLTAEQQVGDSKTYSKLYTEEEEGTGKGNLEEEIGIGNKGNWKGEPPHLANAVPIKEANRVVPEK